jgi:hypothetical protein
MSVTKQRRTMLTLLSRRQIRYYLVETAGFLAHS